MPDLNKNNSIGHGITHLTIAKLSTIAISLLSSMLLSRFRTLEEYGTYSQLLMVINLATSLLMLGLPNSVNYFLARADTEKERKNFLSIYYSLNTLLSAIIGLCLVALIPCIEAYFKNTLIEKYWFFLAFYPWAQITASSISNVLVVYEKTSQLMKINIVNALVAFFAVVIVQVLGFSFNEYLILFLFGNILIGFWIYYSVSKICSGIYFCFDLKTIKKIFIYSIPIGLATLVGTVNIEVDKLMIGNLLGTEAFAIYTNAGKELPLTLLASSITAVLLPKIAKLLKSAQKEKAIRLWMDSVELSYIIICFFSTACIVFAPQIITILYSEKYLAGTSVFRVYALVLLLRTTYFGMILSSVGETKMILKASIISLAGNVLLNYLLYFSLGFVGPAVASFLSLLLAAFMQLVWTSKKINISIMKIFPWKGLFSISIFNMFWGLCAFFTMKLLNTGIDLKSLVYTVLLGLIFMVIYFFAYMKRVKHLWRAMDER